MPFRSTKDSKLQWLQFRINHHILVTNKFLLKIGKTEGQLCTFCHTEIEYIYHLFWDCIFVQQLIREIEIVLDQNDIRFNFRDISFLFGSLDTKATSVPHNLIVMTFKRYQHYYKDRLARTMEKRQGIDFCFISKKYVTSV